MAKEQPAQNPDASKPPRPGLTSSQSASNGRVSPQPPLLGWPISKAALPRNSSSTAPKSVGSDCDLSETEMMKERFAKLLLGEDMSGSGNGVCTALAISNAITNLCATIFGQLWRLEPLPPEKKSMWKREMEWLICVSDQIVEFMPSWQNFADGSKLEVMSCRPRTDIFINLPALRKLDNMLLEILESFKDTEFWYVDQGIESEGSGSLPKALQRQEEKWWLPVPRVPSGGLKEDSRRRLDHKRECSNQILKAALAINTSILADMEVPDSFLEALPKTGKACLGDMIYRYITSDRFSPERLLDCLDLSSEHVALEIANRVEAAINVWRRRLVHGKPVTNPNRSSWGMVKDMMVDGDKRDLLAERAERLLICLKQQYPGLTQTTLDTSKIQCNKDVGKSILESYSRVLESLAFNIVARIDDVLYIDDLTKSTDKLSSNVPTVSIVTHKKVSSSSTPRKASTFAPSPAPSSVVSSSKRDRTPFVSLDGGKPPRRGGARVRRVLTGYLTGETRTKSSGNLSLESPRMSLKGGSESPTIAHRIDKENIDPQRI